MPFCVFLPKTHIIIIWDEYIRLGSNVLTKDIYLDSCRFVFFFQNTKNKMYWKRLCITQDIYSDSCRFVFFFQNTHNNIETDQMYWKKTNVFKQDIISDSCCFVFFSPKTQRIKCTEKRRCIYTQDIYLLR